MIMVVSSCLRRKRLLGEGKRTKNLEVELLNS